MGRKLRQVLIFLLIILKEPNMPESSYLCTSRACQCTGRRSTSLPQHIPTSVPRFSCVNNKITSVPRTTFSNLKFLQQVCLQGNHITHIKSGTFSNLLSLNKLTLSRNQISYIYPGAFTKLPQLQVLKLYSNKITEIQTGTISNLLRLRWLSLQYNQITSIESHTFSNLPQLEYLQLFNNKIIHIQPFSNLPWLKKLQLNCNQITHLRPHTFSNLPRLQEMSLFSNRISHIQSGAFSNLPRLQELLLFCNQINHIQPGAFSNLHELRKLWLTSNKISSIGAGTLSIQTQVQMLVPESNKFSTGTNLSNLESLNLACNRITCIPFGEFSNLPKLTSLDLSFNKITYIQSETFSNLPKLKYLRLNNNQISTFSLTAYSVLASFSTVNINNNPWQCDCRMVPFRQKMIIKSPSLIKQITCYQPSHFSGQTFEYIDSKDLSCEDSKSTPFLDIPKLCTSTVLETSPSFGTTRSITSPKSGPLDSTFATLGDDRQTSFSSTVPMPLLDTSESITSPKSSPLDSTVATLPVDAQTPFTSVTYTASTPSFSDAKGSTSPRSHLDLTGYNFTILANKQSQRANDSCCNDTATSHYHWYFKRSVNSAFVKEPTGDTNRNRKIHDTIPVPTSILIAITDTSHEPGTSRLLLLSVIICSGIITLTATIIWWKKSVVYPPSAQNLQFVFHANGLYPVGHGLTHGNTRGQNQHSPEYEDVDNDHDQTGQGQSYNNTESHTNTTDAIVTSGHDQTGQCQSHNNTESHTNTTDAVGATGHAQTIQNQYRPSIEILGAKKNPYYGTHETASRLNAEYSVSQSQASSDSNTNPKSTVVTGDQTGQSQYKVQAGVEVLDVRNPYYSRRKTASKLNPEYGVMGQS